MKTKVITKIALLVAVLIVLSQVAIPVVFSPTPISLGLVGVYLIGVFLKPRASLIAITVYILLGLIGIPVFAGFKGGIYTLFGPTGGYIFSYIIICLVISNVRLISKNSLLLVVTLVLSLIICYGIGTIWLAYFMEISFVNALPLGVYPFIIGDIVKILVTVVFVRFVDKLGILE